jgi:hypothetical protein
MLAQLLEKTGTHIPAKDHMEEIDRIAPWIRGSRTSERHGNLRLLSLSILDQNAW